MREVTSPKDRESKVSEARRQVGIGTQEVLGS